MVAYVLSDDGELRFRLLLRQDAYEASRGA